MNENNNDTLEAVSAFKGLFGFGKKENNDVKRASQNDEDMDEENEENSENKDEDEDNDSDDDGGDLLMPVVEWIGGMIPKLANNLK